MIVLTRNGVGSGTIVTLGPGDSLREVSCPDGATEHLTLLVPDSNDTFRAELDRRQALLEDDPEHIGPTQPYVSPAPAVPSSASKLGLKRALVEQGRWDMVKAAIAADADRQEEWDLATEIRRSDPITRGVIALLNLSADQVDALLIRATALVA